jgi:predicted fused transcriptional regulator/phosphomethylpyrimidine kinase/predicted transcriptional regulator
MKFIEEIAVEEFLPTYRSLLAEALSERGRTQNEIAEFLGISQSAVSKYVHGEVEHNERIAADERVQELVDRLADRLASGGMTPVEALVEAEVCIHELSRDGVLADLHREAVPELSGYDAGFAVHDPDSRLREAGRVRASVRRGLRMLENTSGFAALVPAVGSNLVECLADAADIEDVAGVPGRILDVRGRAEIPGEPDFGVSQYVASTLLAARAAGSDARAAANVAYDEPTVVKLENEGLTTVEFDAAAPMEEAVVEALEAVPDADVLYQTGAMGVEPIVYVLGPDAVTVAERVRAIA